jgi:hypothetical protein
MPMPLSSSGLEPAQQGIAQPLCGTSATTVWSMCKVMNPSHAGYKNAYISTTYVDGAVTVTELVLCCRHLADKTQQTADGHQPLLLHSAGCVTQRGS